MNEIPKCKKCGVMLDEYPPVEHTLPSYLVFLKIPFTNIKLFIINDKKTFIDRCWNCERDIL